jgi:hypothetical protein
MLGQNGRCKVGEMATLFSDEGTIQLLDELVEQLASGELARARITIRDRLDYERMLRASWDATASLTPPADPVALENADRAYETGIQLWRCLGALEHKDLDAALKIARGASARWDRR